MPRQRDYAAERAARDAKYQREYGLSYNQFENLRRQAKKAGIEGTDVRATLAKAKPTGKGRQLVKELTVNKAKAKAAYKRNQPVDYAAMSSIGDDYGVDDLPDSWMHYHED